MADVHNFVIPEQPMNGLYKVSDTIQERKQRDYELNRVEKGRKSSTASFLSNYLDPKDNLTGTAYDPQIVKGFDELLQQGIKLSNEGADPNMMMMALAPGVAKLNQYSSKAKLIAAQKKQTLSLLEGQKGIDLRKFADEFDNEAFYDIDEKTGDKRLKDISTINPEVMHGDAVLKKRDVFNNEGVKAFVTDSGKDTRVEKVKRINSKGGYYSTDAELVHPSYMQPQLDGNGAVVDFEPKFEYATGENDRLMHDFKGNGSKDPIKMVTNEVFNSLNPNSKAYILQEARKAAKANGKDVSDPSVENFAKAIAYDELKNAAKNSSTIKDIVDTKENPAPKFSVHVTNNNTGSGSNVNDVHGRIYNEVKRLKDYGEEKTRATLLDSDGQEAVLNAVNKGRKEDEKLSVEEVFIKISDKDELLVLDSNGNLKTTLPKVGTNIKVQTGKAGKDAVVAQGEGKSNPKLPSKTPKYKGLDKNGNPIFE